MKYSILSDIHGSYRCLCEGLERFEADNGDMLLLLGIFYTTDREIRFPMAMIRKGQHRRSINTREADYSGPWEL
ncbi:MAG: hypothetical protein ACLR23_18080 [Clostridia bacterium]